MSLSNEVLADTILNHKGADCIVTRFNDPYGEVLVFTDATARDNYVSTVEGNYETGEFLVDTPSTEVEVAWARK